MIIREATLTDKTEVVELYIRSQGATGLPDPLAIPSTELGDHLYARDAICRYVAVDLGRVIAHALIEPPNPNHINIWRSGLKDNDRREMIEIGGAFIDPLYTKRGIWTQLLEHRLSVIKGMEHIPVSATWSQNQHVARTFIANGGKLVGQQETHAGSVNLFVF